MHVNTEALIDIAEGTRPESAAPHLASCQRCRAQLRDLRAMMSAAREVDVPDPSPLFWDHLSSRVRDAVAADAVPRRSWLDVATWRRVSMSGWGLAAATIVLSVVLSSRLMAPQPPPGIDARSAHPPPPVLSEDANSSTEALGDAAPEDASLMLMAGLASTLDLDAAAAAGLAPSGSAEHAVTHMSDGELRELRRLLQQEFTRSGV